MNPRASDKVRHFQDTIIVVGDVRLISVILGATLGAEGRDNKTVTIAITIPN